MRPIYFDYNATTPVLPQIFEAMRPYLTHNFGNPSSEHMWGAAARQGVDLARKRVAALLGCRTGEVYFTSCATESNNLVLRGLLEGVDNPRLITTTIEHPAILEPARFLAARGVELCLTPVDARGVLDLEAFEALCAKGATLASVMLANNESGAVQPVARAAEIARKHGIAMHSDASQAVGKIPVEVSSLGVDYLSIAGHKLYAPKGVGALYVRGGSSLGPMMLGGGQEAGLRPGTENVPYLAGLGAACELASRDLDQEMRRQRALGEQFVAGLESLGPEFVLHCAEAKRLPNTMSIGFMGFSAGDILSGLVGLDVAVSAGAACHHGQQSVSHVLTAMNADPAAAAGTLRFSWGRATTQMDVAELLARLGHVLSELG